MTRRTEIPNPASPQFAQAVREVLEDVTGRRPGPKLDYLAQRVSVADIAAAVNRILQRLSGNSAPVYSSAVSAGHVLQIVTAENKNYASGDDQIPVDDTIPQKTEGFAVVNASITPKSDASKLLIEVEANLLHLSSAGTGTIAIFMGSAADAVGASIFVGENRTTLKCQVDSPGKTATAIQVRAGPSSALTLFINGNSANRLYGGVSTFIVKITEIAA